MADQGGGDLLQQQEDISRSKFNYAVPGKVRVTTITDMMAGPPEKGW